ncbi:MAG: hypothetical protein J0L86_04925 [Flavobacteriales bacterium]|nr:hypothetical protein [Flavobacteriales bacterium]
MIKFLDKIVQFNTINVVGIFRKEDNEEYYALKISKKKSSLNIVSIDYFSEFDHIKNKIDAKIPVLLLIDGKGIVNKKIELKNEVDVDWVKKLDYNSIHFLSYSSNENQFFSICRQSVTDEIIERFQKTEYQIIDVYIGSIVASLLNSTLQKSKLFSNTSILNFEGESLTDVLKDEQQVDENVNYQFGETLLSKFHLPLYGAAVHFFTQHPSIAKNESKVINKEEVFYKKAFNTLGLFMLIGFFVMLLSSYILIQYYNSKNTELNLKSVYSNQSFELVQKLEKQKEKKLEIVKKTGISSPKFNSFYNYEIVRMVPSEISLNALETFPVIEDIKNNKEIVFDSKIIMVKGETRNETVFNNWIGLLRNQNWVKNLEINSIKKDKKNTTFFEITLFLKNV